MGQRWLDTTRCARAAVETYRRRGCEATGDGMCAAFDDPLDARRRRCSNCSKRSPTPRRPTASSLAVRCGVHAGVVERRDNDFFGDAVNRAARIMAAAPWWAGARLACGRNPGQPTACIAEWRCAILGVVRLRDLTGAEHIYQLLHPQLRADFPVLRTLEATPNNLPQQLTSFVGRERELSRSRGSCWPDAPPDVGGSGRHWQDPPVAATRRERDGPATPTVSGSWNWLRLPIRGMCRSAVASVLGVTEELGHPVAEALCRFAKRPAAALGSGQL